MEIQLYNQQAETLGTIKVADELFGAPMNSDLLYQAVTAQRANQRQPLAHTKGRGEVRGGGKKPWKQKGTGRARHGSIRSPIWKGGGVTHGPLKEKDYSKKINRKVARKALAIALSAKLRDGQIAVLDALNLNQIKTKEAAVVIRKIKSVLSGSHANSSILLVLPAGQEKLYRAVRNLASVETMPARNVNSLDVMSSKYVVLLEGAVRDMEKNLNNNA